MKNEFIFSPCMLLAGARLRDIFSNLHRAGYRISPVYLHRFVFSCLLALILLPFRFLQQLLFSGRVARTTLVKDPVFVLGHWRSGTTHMHNLLTQDPKWGFASNYDVFMPNLFLIGGSVLKTVVGLVLPKVRPMDNVAITVNLPQEEEFACCTKSRFSMYYHFFFPRRMKAYFDSYVMFSNDDSGKCESWKKNYHNFILALTYKNNGKQLVLKNPPNTARVQYLLEMYPNAKFIYLYRDPYEVYKSSVRMHTQVSKLFTFQDIDEDHISRCVMEFYPKVVNRFMDDAARIPQGNLCAVSYEYLRTGPMEVLQGIYETLGLEGYDDAKAAFAAYLKTQAGFKTASYAADGDLRRRIDAAWGPAHARHSELPQIAS